MIHRFIIYSIIVVHKQSFAPTIFVFGITELKVNLLRGNRELSNSVDRSQSPTSVAQAEYGLRVAKCGCCHRS